MTTSSTAEADTKLGTFGGVFTPSVLTILGLVLFLRLGFVAGNVGLIQMLVILGVSTAVSLLTTVSLAAIATNLRVGGGGVYYLISRTLGPAFGGAIGLVLYVAMSVSVAFYSIGLGEAVASVVGSDRSALPRLIAAGVIVLLVGIAWLGADIATRFQYVVMGCLAIALAGYFIGVLPELSSAQLGDNLDRPIAGDGFWVSFAVFFPAVTGFTQGVAMSGDLRNPSRSITVGTFSAIGLSTVVYALVVLTFAMAVPLSVLREDTAIMRELSLHPALVDLGVIAATLSSAIASMLGGPRTLQRLAGDRLIRPLLPFATGSGPEDNPRRAILLSAAIALGTVAAGDLDVIAPVISMFFLASYGMVNYATYSEARSANTSFRPTFRWFDWKLSLLGTLACLGAILAISPIAGGFAGVAVFGLYRILRRSGRQSRWADSTRGFHAAEVRTHLQSMSQHQDAGREWRPCTVAFVPRDPGRRGRLIDVASWIEGGSGFSTAARIVPGRGPIARQHAHSVALELDRELLGRESLVYGRVLVAADLEAGVSAMLQAHGVGALRANLGMFSWFELQRLAGDAERRERSEGILPSGDGDNGDSEASHAEGGRGAMLQTGLRLGCNVALVHASDEGWRRLPESEDSESEIAIWWSDDRSGQLLVLLAWLCTRAQSIWSEATLHIWVDENSSSDAEAVRTLVEAARIPARVAGSVAPVRLVDVVAPAHLVFAPLRIRHGEAYGPGGIPVERLVDDLPLVVFAQAAAEIDLDMQPDDDALAIIAEARDRATEADERSSSLDRVAASLIVDAERRRLNGESSEVIAAAEDAALRAHRKYLDARSRAEEAWRVVRDLDPTASSDDMDPAIWVEAEPGVDEGSR